MDAFFGDLSRGFTVDGIDLTDIFFPVIQLSQPLLGILNLRDTMISVFPEIEEFLHPFFKKYYELSKFC